MATPKYQAICEQLRADIHAGRYQPGAKMPSEAALVDRFGASRITVGHALRELQREGVVDRIAGSGTYLRRPHGNSPAGLLFGLIIPNLGETEIFEPICQAISAALLWPHADPGGSGKEEQALQLCEQCISRRVAGVFFAPLELSAQGAGVNRRVLQMLRKADIPVVLLDRRAEDSETGQRCDLVGIDNHRAGFLAAAHLLRTGARRIGFLSRRYQAATVQERIRGYRDALEGAPAHIFQFGDESPMELPAAASGCDAFVCANDRIAGQLMHVLLSRGVKIPKDVRIAGIDDVNYAALLPVPLTTVHQPCRDIGETALRLMLERLERPKMPARDVLLDCELVIRQSG